MRSNHLKRFAERPEFKCCCCLPLKFAAGLLFLSFFFSALFDDIFNAYNVCGILQQTWSMQTYNMNEFLPDEIIKAAETMREETDK